MGRRTCRPGVVHKIERELISERTIAGLASARARGRSGDDTLADAQRAELAAATAGAVWAALLWWLEDGRDLAPADAADAVLKLLTPGLAKAEHA